QVVSGTATTSSVEQVTQQVYDVLDRVTEVKRGVSGTGHDMGSGYATLPTMTTISWTQYDSAGVGDSHVTVSLSFHDTGSTDNTGQAFQRDFRGFLRGIKPVHTYNTSTGSSTTIGPFPVYDVDWKGRTTATAIFGTEPTWSSVISNSSYASGTSTNRKTLSKTMYDDLGRVYRSEEYRVIQSTGAANDRTQTDRYYDRNSQLVAQQTAYSSGTEFAYDAVGRRYETRVVADLKPTKYNSGAFNYRAPLPHPSISSVSGGD